MRVDYCSHFIVQNICTNSVHSQVLIVMSLVLRLSSSPLLFSAHR